MPQSPVSAAVAAQRFNSSPARLAQRLEMFYVYVAASAGNIAQNTSATFNITLQADYDFMVYALAATIVDSTNVVVLPANSTANVQINDTGAGANWFSQPAGLSSLFGSAQLPLILPVVRVVARTATLAFTVQNVKDGAAAAGATYTLSLIGSKIKPQTGIGNGVMG